MGEAPPLLEARGLVKVYPGVRALDGADFTLRAGEVNALMGENGAGKSTLIKALTGAVAPDAGEVRLDGRVVRPRSPVEAQRLGISTVYQEVNLAPNLSLAENLLLGRQPRRFGLIDRRAVRRRAEAIMAGLGVRADVGRPLGSLPIAVQQMAAIGRALDLDARVLVLDEPTSSLDAEETARLFGVVRSLTARGMGVVFITHFIGQVYEVCGRITVMRGGRVVAVRDAGGLPRLELVALMLGVSMDEASAIERAHARAGSSAEVAMRARGLRRGRVGPIDLDLRRGGALGLAGLLGSGRTETARMIAGADRHESGRVEIDGRSVPTSPPRRAIAAGVALCPEDRKAEAILPGLSVRENIALAVQARQGWWRPIGRRAQRNLAERFVRSLRIATPGVEKPAGELSGGNQQKVVLARWLAAEPRVLLLDEPTRGIDVGAKAEIERLVGDLCARGVAVLFISSEVEEVARVCDRVLVLRDGRVAGELSGEGVTVAAVMRLIAAEGERA
ncbi:MAG TPA: sugar ABC transporter ATP-binding protein [Phycisphaerales bacterium]|nr:sugar ABC transporter ATP-binding protein [Phycisphaerales bacterium]